MLIKNMDNKIKMAVIAGASKTLEFLKIKPDSTNEEIMQRVTDNAEKIVEKIDESLDEME